jgi:3-hydroxyisobutyrate dehydrogenase-like beta-hydroxyacid dehydrogenase
MKAVFIGLGRMGGCMAKRSIEAGMPLGVWNRDRKKTEAFRAAGAECFESLEGALEGADLAITMLSDDFALKSAINRPALKLLAPGAVHVSMGTAGLPLIKELAELLESSGRHHLSAPVFGRPAAAAAGGLQICLAGPAPSKEKAKPFLSPMGKIWDFGENPIAANAAKLAGNLMISSLIESLSEAFSLVEKSGGDPRALYGVLTGSLFDCPAAKLYGGIVLDKAWDEAGFTASLGLKDLGLAKEAASSLKIPMPFASMLEDRFLRAVSRGLGDKDWTVIAGLQREDAGLDSPKRAGKIERHGNGKGSGGEKEG